MLQQAGLLDSRDHSVAAKSYAKHLKAISATKDRLRSQDRAIKLNVSDTGDIAAHTYHAIAETVAHLNDNLKRAQNTHGKIASQVETALLGDLHDALRTSATFVGDAEQQISAKADLTQAQADSAKAKADAQAANARATQAQQQVTAGTDTSPATLTDSPTDTGETDAAPSDSTSASPAEPADAETTAASNEPVTAPAPITSAAVIPQADTTVAAPQTTGAAATRTIADCPGVPTSVNANPAMPLTIPPTLELTKLIKLIAAGSPPPPIRTDDADQVPYRVDRPVTPAPRGAAPTASSATAPTRRVSGLPATFVSPLSLSRSDTDLDTDIQRIVGQS
jgi:hypothetical protein